MAELSSINHLTVPMSLGASARPAAVATLNEPSSSPSPPLLSTSALGAVLLIGQQFGSRALTFVVNQLLVRYLSPERLGIATQLDLYSITVLFFARESLRVAIQRQSDTPDDTSKANQKENVPNGYVDGSTTAGKTQAVINLAHVSVFFGSILAFVLAWIYLHTKPARDPTLLETPYFKEALKIYGFSVFCELLAEPCYVVVQQKSRFGIRATAESVATILRCVVTCISTVWATHTGRDIGVLPFALGQGVYAVLLSLLYHRAVRHIASTEGFSLMPKHIFSIDPRAYVLSYFSWPLLTLSGSFFAQSIAKHVLTQGDSLLIPFLASPRLQGVYTLANNYGGLIARLLLQPIEESSRNYFGKLLSSIGGTPSKDHITKAKGHLMMLLRAYVILSLCVLSVGPTVAPLLLKIMAGSRWINSGAGEVLAAFCYYIPLLAINGLSEAFVSSVATESELNFQTVWMSGFMIAYAGVAIIYLKILHFGATGFVWANAFNMLLRITWCASFIRRYFQKYSISFEIPLLMPRPISVATAVVTYAALAQMESIFTGGIADILKTGAVAATFGLLLAASERDFLAQCFSTLQGKK